MYGLCEWLVVYGLCEWLVVYGLCEKSKKDEQKQKYKWYFIDTVSYTKYQKQNWNSNSFLVHFFMETWSLCFHIS